MTVVSHRKTQQGFSLVELAVAMSLGVMVTLGVASIVQTAVSASVSDKTLKQQTFIHSHIITRLQTDMALATAVEVPASGTQVTIEYLTSSGLQTVTWAYDNVGGTFTRGGIDILDTLGDTGSAQMTLSCADPCFLGLDQDSVSTTGIAPANPIMLFELDSLSAQNTSNDAMRQAFGAAAAATTDSYEFYVPAARSFE